MVTNTKSLLALLAWGMIVAPAVVAEGQTTRNPHQVERQPIKRSIKRPVIPVRKVPAPLAKEILFAGGLFQMGSDTGEPDAKPAHTSSVSPFKIQRQEVTVAEYKKCVDAKQCTAPNSSSGCNWGQAGRDNNPVNCIDYYQATKYCEFLGMRLPTEQEWEFAAKFPDDRVYPWGAAQPTDQLCWKGSSSCPVGAHVAGRSASGLDDMSGNVAEWTASPFCPHLSSGCTTTVRAVRGGGWSLAVATKVQTSSRAGFNKGVRSATIGVRCAATISPPK